MGRMIGITHKRKKTVDGEARPTRIAIVDSARTRVFDLPDDQAEFDFVRGVFPVQIRKITAEDNLADYLPHHITWREVKKNEDISDIADHFLKKVGKKLHIATHVPSEYEGLAANDTVAMMLGGSGDMLAYAIARKLERIGGYLVRIPPFVYVAERGDEKEDACEKLVHLAIQKPRLFYEVRPRDKQLVLVRELHRQHTEVLKARIGCEVRLRQTYVGKIFAGDTVEVEIEKKFEEMKANNFVLQNIYAEERGTSAALERAIKQLDVYTHVFQPIEGVGPKTSARIINGIVDIRRFANRDKFVSFCGTSPTKDGTFRRFKRKDSTAKVSGCSYSPSVRQGLYLIISDQANKRPNSEWGKRLRAEKAKLREKHPVPEIINGKKRYTNGHVYKMAVWKTMTKLARYIYREWKALEAMKTDIAQTDENVSSVA